MKEFTAHTDLTLIYPENWTIEIDDHVFSLFEPAKGFGALQFSIYGVPMDEKRDLATILVEFIGDTHDAFKINNQKEFACATFIEKQRAVKYWLFKRNHSAIFVTYNCKLTDTGKEKQVVDEIIRNTFSLTESDR